MIIALDRLTGGIKSARGGGVTEKIWHSLQNGIVVVGH